MDTNQSTETSIIQSEDLEVTFRLSERNHRYEETQITRTYGIEASFIDSEGKMLEKSVNDISSVKSIVEKIIFRLREEKVSFFHLESVIEDLLFAEGIL